jgi:hypothetical protein
MVAGHQCSKAIGRVALRHALLVCHWIIAITVDGRNPPWGPASEITDLRDHMENQVKIVRLSRRATCLIGMTIVLWVWTAVAQTARDIRGPAAVASVANEPAPKIVIDPPLPGPLALGRVVIQYATKNLRIVPVFGITALNVSPRIGHIHVTVDDAPWRWADASGEPLILNGFPSGTHKVLIELVNANHQTLDKGVVTFVIPKRIETQGRK